MCFHLLNKGSWAVAKAQWQGGYTTLISASCFRISWVLSYKLWGKKLKVEEVG